MNKARLNSLIVVMPLIIILIVGVYFVQNIWSKYVETLDLQKHLNKTELYQSLEESVTQEILCAAKMSYDHQNLPKVCQVDRDKTDKIIEQLNVQTSKRSLADILNAFFSESNQPTQPKATLFGDSNMGNTLRNIRYNIDVSREIKLEDLLRGEYYRKVLAPIQKYWSDVIAYGNYEHKPYLTFFTDMSELYTNSGNEAIYITYFLANKRPFLTSELNTWDNYIKQAVIPDISGYKYITPILTPLNNLFLSKETETANKKLDDLRIDILLNYTDGQYTVAADDWIKAIDEKNKIFEKAKQNTLRFLIQDVTDNVEQNESILLASTLAAILSIILIIFSLVRNYLAARDDDKALQRMMQEIEALTSESQNELLGSGVTLDSLSDKKQIYAYFGAIIKLLHEKELMAEEASVAKDLFLANMSHEIRTPLNGIVGFTQLLKETNLSRNQQEFIDIIVNSSENLLSIVNDILDLSKINAHKMELEYISFNLYKKMESAVETFAAKADEKNIELGIFIDPKVPQRLFGDPTKLSQVIVNLISNAVKFTPFDGEISLFVRLVEDEENYSTVRFSVKDNGIGINKEKLQSIFQAFSQEDSSTSRKYGGTGLGLTISNNIVNFMGGELKVESVENQGSEFYFTIRMEKDIDGPQFEYRRHEGLRVGFVIYSLLEVSQLKETLKAYLGYLGVSLEIFTSDQLFEEKDQLKTLDILIVDHSHFKREGEIEQFIGIGKHLLLLSTNRLKQLFDPVKHHYVKILPKPLTLKKLSGLIDNCVDGAEVEALPQTETLKGGFTKVHALVAEDNAINQKLIVVTLERFGIDVTLASNGAEALDARKNSEFDIIFMDIQMPVMSGMEATKAIIEYEKEENLPHIPIIALTANALKGDKEKYMKAGMDDYASKPLDLAEIKKIIAEFLPDKVQNTLIETSAPKAVQSNQAEAPAEDNMEYQLDEETEPDVIIAEEEEESDEETYDTEMTDESDEEESADTHSYIEAEDEYEDFEEEPVAESADDMEETEELIEEETEEVDETDETDETDEADEAEETDDEEEEAILLLTTMKLEGHIYSTMFKGFGYEVILVETPEDFESNIEEYLFKYAIYNFNCFEDDPKRIADKIRDEGAIPIIILSKDDDRDYCAQKINRNMDKEDILAAIQSAS